MSCFHCDYKQDESDDNCRSLTQLSCGCMLCSDCISSLQLKYCDSCGNQVCDQHESQMILTPCMGDGRSYVACGGTNLICEKCQPRCEDCKCEL